MRSGLVILVLWGIVAYFAFMGGQIYSLHRFNNLADRSPTHCVCRK